MKKRFMIHFLFFLTFFVGLSGWGSVPSAAPSSCHMYVFNVGAANFILFTAGGGDQQKNLIVDAGYDKSPSTLENLYKKMRRTVVSKKEVVTKAFELMNNKPTTVIVSHLDQDHYCLLNNLFTTFPNKYDLFIGSHLKTDLLDWAQKSNYALEIENKKDGEIWCLNEEKPTNKPTQRQVLDKIKNSLGRD